MQQELSLLGQRLQSSTYILVLLGAGISAPSGIPTFLDLPNKWRGHSYMWLTSTAAFEQQPGLVWAFYESLRQIALRAQPNSAHYALAELARIKPHLLTISQNIDDLCERAGHLPPQLVSIHGSIFGISCSNTACPYVSHNYGLQPIVPALILPTYDVSDSVTALPTVHRSQLPHCPVCKTYPLRPGVVRFGELLTAGSLDAIDGWMDEVPQVDLALVIGTSADLSSQFVNDARAKGASVAHFNVRYHDTVEGDDHFILGDVAVTLPLLVRQLTANKLVPQTT